MLSLLKYLDGPWEAVRGYLREDLEHIQAAINSRQTEQFGGATGSTLQAGTISGDDSQTPRYVANTGQDNAPKWDQVDLSSSGVRGRIPYSKLPQADAATLIGRRDGISGGDYESVEIDEDAGLDITSGSNPVLSVKVDGSTVDFNGSGELTATGSGGTVTHTGTLTANRLIIGNGSADIKEIGSASTSTQVLHGGEPPTWSAIASADLPTAIKTRDITYIFDNNGSTLNTGVGGDLYIPYACTITAVTLLADQSGSVVVDIWKDTYANYPPTNADSIVAAAKPTITTALKSQDTTLTGWTTAIAAGNTLRFNVDSVTSITRLTLTLTVTL